MTLRKEQTNFDRANFKVAVFYGTTFHNAFFSDCVFRTLDFSKSAVTGVASFSGTTFQEIANFLQNEFDEVYFSGGIAQGIANFSKNIFHKHAFFNQVLFEHPNKVIFNDSDLSNVSFADSDITRARFGDKITWGNGSFSIVEEEWLKQKSEGLQPEKDVPIDSITEVNTMVIS
jgi:uncharacterized protein YjbI with pentapeptide repeats